MLYAISGPSSPSYASCAIAKENGSTGDSQWSSVHGFKTDIIDQTCRDIFRVMVVPAVQAQ